MNTPIISPKHDPETHPWIVQLFFRNPYSDVLGLRDKPVGYLSFRTRAIARRVVSKWKSEVLSVASPRHR